MYFDSPLFAQPLRFRSFEELTREDLPDLSWFKQSRPATPEVCMQPSSPGSPVVISAAIPATSYYEESKTHRRGRRWTLEDDELLIRMVEAHGTDWREIALRFPGKSSKQVKERWCNQLDPRISDSPWTLEDDFKLVTLIRENGRSWCKISKEMDGRTELMLKNRFHSFLRKKLHPDIFEKRGKISKDEEFAVKNRLAKFSRRPYGSGSTPSNGKARRSASTDENTQENAHWVPTPLI